LEDGKQITVQRAPTAFGPVSVRMQSRLSAGEIVATVELPSRHPPQRALLRARVPDGWRITSADVGGKALAVDDRGTVDLSGQRGAITVKFSTARAPASGAK
jgi:hypothetical protein